MAITVKVGDVYEMTNKKSGVGKSGDFVLFEVRAAKGTDRVTVFVNNPRDKNMKEAPRCKILNITEASLAKREVNGKWYQNYNVYCDVEPIVETTGQKFDEFMGGPTAEEIDALFGLT